MTTFRNKVRQLGNKAKKMVTKVTAMAVAGVMLLSACPMAAQAFSYHTNEIRTVNCSPYELKGGSFKIQDFRISEGQDPEQIYYVGRKVDLEQRSPAVKYFFFCVGRHSTESTADFWNLRFGKDNALRGDSEKMSFCFLGKMDLTISDPYKGETYDVTFENIGMAQEHRGTKDLWHFGQMGGKCLDENTLEIYGTARDLGGDRYNAKVTYKLDTSSSCQFLLVNAQFDPA